MPENSEAERRPELPEHVKAYFSRRHLDPDRLPPHTRAAFASLSPAQVAGLDSVGSSLEEDGADAEMYVFSVH